MYIDGNMSYCWWCGKVEDYEEGRWYDCCNECEKKIEEKDESVWNR